MKTIATAAVLMMLTGTAWADEAQGRQANDPATYGEAIVLSDTEMDGVAAGADGLFGPKTRQSLTETSEDSGDRFAMVFQSYALYPHMGGGL